MCSRLEDVPLYGEPYNCMISYELVVLCRCPPNQKGLEDPKTNSGYKTLIYFSAQANWRRPVLTEITREIMFFLKPIDLYHVV